jgi:tetratricopeptide (TPR) repeat protein
MSLIFQKAFLAFFIVLFARQSWSASNPMLEIRFAQAELAFIDGDEQEGLRLLRENLEPGDPHIPTYRLLSRIYLTKEEFSKSFRVLYVLIRRLHPNGGPTILAIQDRRDIARQLRRSAPPNREALETYFLIGSNYFRLAERPHFPAAFRGQLYELAHKYFSVTDYYRFEMPQTSYFLGVIASRRRNYQDAITRLIEARELFSKEEGEGASEQIQGINFLLGDSLIRSGYRDAGTLYLNSLYLDDDVNESLKQYSKAYLDNLASSFALITVGVTGNYRENLYRFTDSFLDDFDRFKEILGENNGSSITRSANYLYSSRRFNHMIYTARLNFREDRQREAKHWRLDNRLLSGTFEVRYDNLKRSIVKLSYSQNHLFTRPGEAQNFKANTQIHNINPEYVHTLRKGTITYRAPITIRTRKNSNSTRNHGLAVSYVPFYRTQWIGPSLSAEYTFVDETTHRTTRQTRASLSNHLRPSPIWSTFAFASYSITDHELDRLSQNELTLNLFNNILLRFIRNLSLQASVARSMAKTKEDDKITTMTYSLGLNYSF